MSEPELVDAALAWARAVDRTPHVPRPRAEREELFHALTRRLVAGLHAEPFDPMVGYWVATDLVCAGFDAPEALGRSLEVIETRLGDVGPDPTTQPRVRELGRQFASGFARALRDRTLDSQEEIRSAAITTRVRVEQGVRRAALHDQLTLLPNRYLFLRELREVCGGPEPELRFGVCHIGLDGLAAAKASLGPSAGDDLLRTAANRLRDLADEWGHLAARWGDDQFVLLVRQTTCVDDVAKVADRVLRRLSAPYHLADDLDVPVTVTAGLVEQPAAGTDPIEVIRAADLARHWAAADGEPWMVFDHERSARDQERYRLTAALPRAVKRREFVLHYQPMVDLATGRIAGLEALARWEHPTLGTLLPQRFIELTESTGMIVPLGLQLLEDACREAVRWRQLTDHPPFVSVNLAVAQLRQPGLAGAVAAILDRTGLPPHLLQLEITETVLIDPDRDRDSVAALRSLTALGIRAVIDDFGTGYSNLAYLPMLSIHGLKLAHTFLAGSAGDWFLRDLVSLGHTLGLTVTGEGVETGTHARRLGDAHADLGQGWHFGRPVPASRIADLLR